MLIEIALVKASSLLTSTLSIPEIDQAATVAVVITDELEDNALRALALRVVAPGVSLVSAYGKRGERFHDLVDEIRVAQGQSIITTWTETDNIEETDVQEFLRTVVLTFRGSIGVSAQLRPMLIYYVTNDEHVPETLTALVRVLTVEGDPKPRGGLN